jgi:hypothetical protein
MKIEAGISLLARASSSVAASRYVRVHLSRRLFSVLAFWLLFHPEDVGSFPKRRHSSTRLLGLTSQKLMLRAFKCYVLAMRAFLPSGGDMRN